MAGGLIGGIVGQLAGSLVQNIVGNLMETFGGGMLRDAASNLFTGKLGEALKGVVDMLPMPQFIKDAVKDLIDDVIGDAQKGDVDPQCQCLVNEAFGEQAEQAAQSIADDLLQKVLEMMKGETEESSGSAKGGKGTTWFAVLARAMGEIAGKHLDKMIELSDKMQDLTDKDQAGEMSAVQAEFQAESQMFKMASETASTAIKSIGEGLSSMARKQ